MSETSNKLNLIKQHIGSFPDFPKPGIVFRDVFSVLRNPQVSAALYNLLRDHAMNITPKIDCVVALDARGFLFGPFLALQLVVPFVPIRKRGKLPGDIHSVTYQLEYGKDALEVQAKSIEAGKRVLVVDDLLATGGSLAAACQLIRELGAEVAECLVVIELEGLKGRANVDAPIHSLLKY